MNSPNNTLFKQKTIESHVQKLVKIKNVNKGHLIGLEDIVNQRPTTVNFKCVSNHGTLLTVTKKDFLHIVRRDQDLW